MTAKVIIRADGGSEIGYGHLIRSSALAEKILRRGHTVTVATTTPQPVQDVFSANVDLVRLSSRGDPAPFVEWLKEADPNAVFTDAYPVTTEYQRTIRNHATLTVLQDDARHTICADLFVNGNLYGSDIEYEFVGDKPKLCLGTDYALLRQEVRERATETPPWRETPERAIIIMGGSDITGLTPTVVQAFDEFDLQVDTVVGPGCSGDHERAIHQAASNCSADVRVIRNPKDLVERMFQADVAVSTASSTTYELLALGTPIISIPVADNQALIAQALRERDTAMVIEPENLKKGLPEAISRYMNGSKLRRERLVSGRKLVDGEGAERIAELITEMVNN